MALPQFAARTSDAAFPNLPSAILPAIEDAKSVQAEVLSIERHAGFADCFFFGTCRRKRHH
jgi:hypothetical protein